MENNIKSVIFLKVPEIVEVLERYMWHVYMLLDEWFRACIYCQSPLMFQITPSATLRLCPLASALNACPIKSPSNKSVTPALLFGCVSVDKLSWLVYTVENRVRIDKLRLFRICLTAINVNVCKFVRHCSTVTTTTQPFYFVQL